MPAIPLTDTQKKVAAVIGRAQFGVAFKRQHPKATKEVKLASWKQNRKEYLKLGYAAVRQLIKDGYQIVGEGKPRRKRPIAE